MRELRALFANRRFMTFWAGQTVSVVGNGMTPIALAALVLPHYGATGMGAVMAAQSAVFGLALLGGGVIADRMSRTAVMAVADVLRLGGALALLLLLGSAPLWLICVLAGVLGLGGALFQPAYRAVIGQMLPPEQFKLANGTMSTAGRAALMIGAAFAGLLVAVGGGRLAFVVDASTYVVSITTLVLIRMPRVQRAPHSHSGLRAALHDAREGLVAVWRVPWARAVMAQGTLQVVVGFAPCIVLLPAVSLHRYGPGAFGLLTAMEGLGTMLGGVMALRLRPRRDGVIAMHGVAVFALVCLCLAVAVPLWVFAIVQVVAWGGIGVFLTLWFPALQREFPGEVQGRVFALESLTTFALEPVGLALSPLVAAAVGIPAVGVATAVIILITSYGVLFIRGVSTLRSPGRDDRDSVAGADARVDNDREPALAPAS